MKYIFIGLVIILSTIGLVYATTMWECNRCYQQYIGDNPPRFVKCPATNNKQNHWWIKK